MMWISSQNEIEAGITYYAIFVTSSRDNCHFSFSIIPSFLTTTKNRLKAVLSSSNLTDVAIVGLIR